jgi:hypothetical protein
VTRVWGGSTLVAIPDCNQRTTIHRLDQARLALMLNRNAPLLENQNDHEQAMLAGPSEAA